MKTEKPKIDNLAQYKLANEAERKLRKKARGGLATSRKRQGQSGIRLAGSR